MMNSCNFILGDDGSVLITVPSQLPKYQDLTLELYPAGIRLVSGKETLGNFLAAPRDALLGLMSKTRVGIIERIKDISHSPVYISAVAKIEMGTDMLCQEQTLIAA